MQSIQTILRRLTEAPDKEALYWNNRFFSYAELNTAIAAWEPVLKDNGVGRGTVCAFLGDYSPQTAALIFALMKVKAVMVPFTYAIQHEIEEFKNIAGVECMFRFAPDDTWTFERYNAVPRNALIEDFMQRDVPGLIVFSSGSTGKPKGILQDCERVMHKFVEKRPGWRTLLFLMMDHFGGFNTFLSSFAYGGTAVCLPDRNPDTVCRIIQTSRATLLPTTPTFINLLLASRVYGQYDLSSVKMITYGTEVMNAATLSKVRDIFPNAQIKQTYGLSELGVLRSQSESDDSVWVKIGGAGFEVKIVDNILWIRSEANMVGYLNAPSPFDNEGWMCTGDQVEVRGEYMRILGRKSEMINVGGQKVFPVEVENVLMEAGNVHEVSVFPKPHPIMGHVVHAKITLHEPEDTLLATERLRKFCLERMAKYKVPVKFVFVDNNEQHNARFKKIRRDSESS